MSGVGEGSKRTQFLGSTGVLGIYGREPGEAHRVETADGNVFLWILTLGDEGLRSEVQTHSINGLEQAP